MISDFIFSEHVIKDQNGNHGGGGEQTVEIHITISLCMPIILILFHYQQRLIGY